MRMRSERETNRTIERYADTAQRLCIVYLKNHADAEDVFQTVFFKYCLSPVVFESDEHEKTWLIRVTVNTCKDWLKSFFRSRTVSLEEIIELPSEVLQEKRNVLKAVLSLPAKYCDVVYLHYYEQCTAPQIGEILRKNVSAVYTLLTRAKERLRERLGDEAWTIKHRRHLTQFVRAKH